MNAGAAGAQVMRPTSSPKNGFAVQVGHASAAGADMPMVLKKSLPSPVGMTASTRSGLSGPSSPMLPFITSWRVQSSPTEIR